MKERLTGAIILVALLVLLVPELLTGPSRSVSLAQAPSNTDDAQMRSYTINLADDANTHRSTAAPVAVPPAPEAKPAEAAPGDATGGTDADAAKSAGTAQVENADASADHKGDRAEHGGEAMAASAERETAPVPAAAAEAPKPPAATVHAEPSKPAAAPHEAAAPSRAEPPPPARTASEPASRAGSAAPHSGSGWAIQVGSFASRENAERLARELKGKGFAATVSESSGKGKRLWRVRVGPEADRAAAVALGTRLRAAGQPGAVVPYP